MQVFFFCSLLFGIWHLQFSTLSLLFIEISLNSIRFLGSVEDINQEIRSVFVSWLWLVHTIASELQIICAWFGIQPILQLLNITQKKWSPTFNLAIWYFRPAYQYICRKKHRQLTQRTIVVIALFCNRHWLQSNFVQKSFEIINNKSPF